MRFFFVILLVGLLTLWQAWGFSVLNVKPNLALVSLIAASFFLANFWQGLFLIVLAGFILKFAPGFEKEILVFSLIGIGVLAVRKRLPWHQLLNILFMTAVGTAVFYLFLAPNLVVSAVFLKELAFNLILGTIVFALLNFLWQDEKI